MLCTTDNNLLNVGGHEFGRYIVSTKPAKGKGKIKGISVWSASESAHIAICKFSYKRVSTVDPNVPNCP